MRNSYSYHNQETKNLIGGRKMVRKVSIKNGKGYKSVSKYHKGKHIRTSKKNLHPTEIQMIKNGKFIPGLFSDCKSCTKKRR
jgi:hypothetical protein